MVEFTLVLPALALILFAILQFGIVFHDYITLTDAVRAGSRKAVVSRFEPSREQIAKDAVKAAAPRLGLTDAQIVVTSSWNPGGDITVTASHPVDITILGKTFFSGSLESTLTERVE